MRVTLAQYRRLLKPGKKPDWKANEAQLQSLCVAWWRTHPLTQRFPLISIPNEGADRRSPGRLAKLIRMGLMPGAADVFVIMPGATVAFFEFKRSGKGAVQSENQQDFEQMATALGAAYFLVSDFKHFETAALGLVERFADVVAFRRLTRSRKRA